jgi:hypothetical protein
VSSALAEGLAPGIFTKGITSCCTGLRKLSRFFQKYAKKIAPTYSAGEQGVIFKEEYEGFHIIKHQSFC